jgi:hypothetical protein
MKCDKREEIAVDQTEVGVRSEPTRRHRRKLSECVMADTEAG